MTITLKILSSFQTSFPMFILFSYFCIVFLILHFHKWLFNPKKISEGFKNAKINLKYPILSLIKEQTHKTLRIQMLKNSPNGIVNEHVALCKAENVALEVKLQQN